MKNLIKSYNKNISKQLITKTANSESWYKGQLKKSAKELKRFWFQEEYK